MVRLAWVEGKYNNQQSFLGVQHEHNLGKYTKMGMLWVGADLRDKIQFYIEEVQFEMPIGLLIGNVR